MTTFAPCPYSIVVPHRLGPQGVEPVGAQPAQWTASIAAVSGRSLMTIALAQRSLATVIFARAVGPVQAIHPQTSRVRRDFAKAELARAQRRSASGPLGSKS